MITKLATFRGVSQGGEPLVRIFDPGKPLIKEAGQVMPEITKWMASYQPDDNQIAVLVNAMGASEYWGQNVNGDIFPEKALIHDCRNHKEISHPIDEYTGKIIPAYGYWTFLGAYPFVHHQNKDPNRAFGHVALAVWNARMHRVELIVILDKMKAMQYGAQDVIDRILAGEFPDVSMGCRVPYDVCTICGNKARTRDDYCSCIQHIGMGKILDDGRRIGVLNIHPRFFDISFVFIGADKTAKMMCKLASGIWVPQSVADADHLYGYDAADGLMKAASISAPGSMATGATFTSTASKSDLLLGPIDTQEDTEEQKRRGRLEDNGNATEEDDKAPKTASPEVNLSYIFGLARKMKIGPPPIPNRKKYPFTGTINFRGLKIDVENKPGSVRSGVGPSGTKWSTDMKIAYGEIRGTRGTDGDLLDVYVGPDRQAPNVYVVHQNHARGPNKGTFDEDKVMIGFPSAELAKEAYLAHYDSPRYFRSITTMAFPLFKRSIVGEVKGEKVAYTTKIAASLEDLFMSGAEGTAVRRQRTWRDQDTKREVNLTGSGLHMKTAAVYSVNTAPAAVLKIAAVLRAGWTPSQLLKVSNETKAASHLKWADIIKRIGPSKAVGRVSPLLSESESEVPSDTLNEMGRCPELESSLATPSLMGMALKPKEFQRIMLVRMGKEPLADKLDDANAVFTPNDKECSPCSSLSAGHMDPRLMESLLPLLAGKSYLGPLVRTRIAKISAVPVPPENPPTEVESPLLSKVASAYNWYRREQMKLAADIPTAVSANPMLHAGVYGIEAEDIFSSKLAAASPKVPLDARTLSILLGSIPVSLLYSAHKRGQQKKEDVGVLGGLIAEHPWLTSAAVISSLGSLMRTPQGRQAAHEVFDAGGRILRGEAKTEVVL